MISIELLNEIISLSKEYDENILKFNLSNNKICFETILGYDNISIYEAAHSCKIWAAKQGTYGYEITSAADWAEVDFDCHDATIYKVTIEDDEPECIFQVTQWIYDKEKARNDILKVEAGPHD